MKKFKTTSALLAFIFFAIFCSKSDDSPTPELLAKDVYTCGYEFDGTKYVAKLWRNDSATSLSDGEANALVIVDNDVYVAGFIFNGSRNVARYWKNGVATNILNDVTFSSKANSIFVK